MARSLLALTFVLALALIAIARFPASLALDLLLPSVHLPNDLQLRYARGSIWQGQIDLVFRTFPATTVTWEIDGLNPGPRLNLSAKTPNGQSELFVTLSVSSNRVELQALSFFLSSSDSLQLAQEYGHDLAGDLSGEAIHAHLTGPCLDQLSGELAWTGGPLTVNTGSKHYVLNTPPMSGDLLGKDCGPAAQLRAMNQSSATAAFSVNQSGWFTVDISPELIALVDPSGANPGGSMQFEAKIR